MTEEEVTYLIKGAVCPECGKTGRFEGIGGSRSFSCDVGYMGLGCGHLVGYEAMVVSTGHTLTATRTA